MEMISLRNISFSYHNGRVIADLNQDFHQGTFSAIMGPNGSGKTTLIRLMSRILIPEKGTILIDGKPLGKYDRGELAKKMAYVPQQQANVFPTTVFDTVLLGRKPYLQWNPGKRDREICSSVLMKLGLSAIALKDINQLSSGQRQRVFIARALAQEPEIILLDEPTASLDLQHQHEVMTLLQELSRTGITILLAIHDLNLSLKYCSEFLILDQGKKMAWGNHGIISKELIESIYKVEVHIIEKEGETFIIPLKPIK